MKIILNENPLFTLQILEQLSANISSFGSEYFSLEKLELEKRNVLSGKPSRRCSDEMFCYELYSDEEAHIGDITLTPISDKEYEIDLIIFQPNKGYGGLALDNFLSYFNEHFSSDLIAFVLFENKQFEKMVSMLKKRNFQLLNALDNGEEYKFNNEIQ